MLEPVGYPAEKDLHNLVEAAPQMLPLAGSPRLTMLAREVRLGNGYADLIAVESTGRLVIIEVKLAANSESRRAVIAQVLSYAGYLQGLDPDQLESQILGGRLPAGESVLSLVRTGDQQVSVDAEEFRDGLARSLAEGAFRLVIVLDSAPDELVQVAGYLQPVTDKIDIDLVTVTAYDVGGSQVLAPQRIDPGRRTRELSDAEVSARQSGVLPRGSGQFRAVIADLAPAKREMLERLADWADSLDREGLVKLATYQGKSGMTTLLPRLAADNGGLVTIYRDNDDGYLQLWRSAFERRAGLHSGSRSHPRNRHTTREHDAPDLRAAPGSAHRRLPRRQPALKARSSNPPGLIDPMATSRINL